MRTSAASPDPLRRVLKFKQFAAAIAVSTRQLYRLVDEGKAPRPFKIGSQSCYTTEDLEGYLDELKSTRK